MFCTYILLLSHTGTRTNTLGWPAHNCVAGLKINTFRWSAHNSVAGCLPNHDSYSVKDLKW